MCGIAGIVSLDQRPVVLADLRRMSSAVSRPGTEGRGTSGVRAIVAASMIDRMPG